MWGPRTQESQRYLLDAENSMYSISLLQVARTFVHNLVPRADTTILTVHAGHFLAILEHVLGPFSEITASTSVRFATSQLLDSNGTPTGATAPVTSPDQVALTGTLASGVFANIHIRAGVSCTGPRGAGRKLFQWIIDGEEGAIEVVNRPEDGENGAFFTASEKDVYVNGEKVELGEMEVDELGQAGKAWWEFARGDGGEGGGRYTTIEDAVRIHRVLDAAGRSAAEGTRVVL